jgi:hypothetical protein
MLAAAYQSVIWTLLFVLSLKVQRYGLFMNQPRKKEKLFLEDTTIIYTFAAR